MPNTDIDPYSNPLCSGIENNLRAYCGDDIYTCMDLMCEYIATNVIEMYESTTVQRIVEINLVLAALLLTVFGVSYLIRELRYRN